LGTLGCLLKTREDRFLIDAERMRRLGEAPRDQGVAASTKAATC